MILIDDTLDPVIGGNLNDVKEFIKAQPPSTVIGIGYMSNAGVNIVQNFTADHDLAVKAVRLPRGGFSTMDSPYLSLISLVKGWSEQKVRREVLMFSDGIDRLRGEKPSPSRLGPNYGSLSQHADDQRGRQFGKRNQPEIQRPRPLHLRGECRTGRPQFLGYPSRVVWTLQNRRRNGGECYSLGTSTLVSFKPYLERFQRALDNQYYLVFLATPKKNAGLQRVNIQTEVSNSEIVAPNNVWVAAAAK